MKKRIWIVIAVALSVAALSLLLILRPWQHSHTGEWVVTCEPNCGTEGERERVCSTCGEREVEKIASLGHEVKTTVVAPTCTVNGFTQHICLTCDNTYICDIVKATGHSYGDWNATLASTCTARGTQERVCTVCNLKQQQQTDAVGHKFIAVDSREQGGEEIFVWRCEHCERTVESSEETPKFPEGERFVNDCGTDFSFDVYSVHGADYIREHLKIYDACLEGTEYLNSPYAYEQFTVEHKGGNLYTVTPVNPYENSSSYYAVTDGDVGFVSYEDGSVTGAEEGTDYTVQDGDRFSYSIEGDPNHENAFVASDEIKYLKLLEQASPGYYPYTLDFSEDGEYMYLILEKEEGLAVGDLLFVGEITDFNELSAQNGEECYIGEIVAIDQLYTKKWQITMGAPDIGEVFDELDITFDGEINLEQGELSEEFSEELINALYASEDFVEFLASVDLAAQSYLGERGYDTDVLASSFLDKIKITPSARVSGSKMYAKLEGSINLPIKAKGKNLGSVDVKFEVNVECGFQLNASYKIKKKWFIPVGLKYLDLSVTQTDKIGFTFGVEVKMDYTLKENKIEFVQNTDPNSLKVHRADCAYVSRIKDKSKLKELTAEYARDILETGKGSACMICKPEKTLKVDYFVINKSTNIFHIADCYHVTKMSGSNILLSEQPSAALLAQGYSACSYCKPVTREEQDFERRMTESLESTDWGQKVSELSQKLRDAGITKDYAEKGISLVKIPIPISILSVNIDVKFVFSFKLEASLSYQYECEHSNTFGIRVEGGGVRSYSNKVEKVNKNELTVMGRVEVRAGLQIDVSLSISALSRWVRAGFSLEVGMYGEMGGVLHMDWANEGRDYYAAYFEVGIYVDVEAFYKVFGWSGSVDIYDNKFPLLTKGYDRAYFCYDEYHESFEINSDVYDLASSDLLAVQYFNLRKLKADKDKLNPLGVANKYTVTLTLSDDTYCSIQNGKIVVAENAPCYFTTELTIKVDGKQNWKNYVKNNAIYYLADYTVRLEIKANDNHDYVQTKYEAAGCTANGVDLKTCRCCSAQLKVDLPALGHTGGTATCVDRAICERCHAPYGTVTGHSFLEQNTADRYLVSGATCTERATYYYSCLYCDERGTAIFSYGIPAGHDFSRKTPTAAYLGENADCDSAATYYYCCLNCDAIGEQLYSHGNPLGHSYTAKTESAAYLAQQGSCTQPSTFYFSCVRCAARGNVTFVGDPDSGHDMTRMDLSAAYRKSAATCTDAAVYYYTCTICHAKAKSTFESGQALGHSFSAGFCTRCGASETSEGLEYTSNGDGTCYVSGIGVCKDTELKIPAISSSKERVVGIGQGAFLGCDNIVSVSFEAPEQITVIEDYAFNGCEKLTSVVVPAGVRQIGISVFSGCTRLSSIALPANLTAIGSYAFEGCGALTRITIPASVTSIGEGAFVECTALASVSLAQSNALAEIGDYAFYGCTSLTSFTVTQSVRRIGADAFLDCSALVGVTFANVSGWRVYDNADAATGTGVNVSDATTAALYLRDTHSFYYWRRG